MLMKQFLFLIFMISALLPALAQEAIRSYVQQELKPLSITAGMAGDDKDLESLKSAIGNKRVVMLGEICHGDASAFQMKSRIIKYLHEQMNFNVLAFENDFFALSQGWDAFRNKGLSLDSFVRLSVYPVWSQCDGARPVFKYIEEKMSESQPLKLSGIDNQQFSAYTFRYIRKEVDSFLKASGIPFVAASGYAGYIAFINQTHKPKNESYWLSLDSAIANSGIILKELEQRYPAADGIIQIQVIKNIRSFYKQQKYYQLHGLSFMAERDSMMAVNLEWLLTHKYPNEKIIVWAHNAHIFKNMDDDFNKRHLLPYSLGYFFTRDTMRRKETYIIGFTAYQGTCHLMTMAKPVPEKAPSKKSFESWCLNTGYPAAFIDLERFNTLFPGNSGKFRMKSIVGRDEASYWNRMYDGVIYFKEMVPCQPYVKN
jgi:erythromycin esterase